MSDDLPRCPDCQGGGNTRFGNKCFRCGGAGYVDRRPITDEDRRRLVQDVAAQCALHGFGIEAPKR